MVQTERLDGIHVEKVEAGTHAIHTAGSSTYHADPECWHIGTEADTVAVDALSRRQHISECRDCGSGLDARSMSV